MSISAAACCLYAQAPAVKETQGLPARATPADYQAQARAGEFTIAAEFTGHGIPNSEAALNSEDFVAVEVGIFGPPDAHLTITATEFSLRLNGKNPPLPSQQWGLVAKNIKDPDWVPPEGSGSKSKGGGLSGGGQKAGDPPPTPSKPPIELLRGWQQRLRKAALSEGDRALPQAGLLFFQHRGKAENIKSVELIYEGPAGKVSLTLK